MHAIVHLPMIFPQATLAE